jgi:methyl-accepting chemotaxis protein
LTATIASAVKQQGAATQEISANAQTAAQGNASLVGSIGTVNKAIAHASRSAGEVFSAAEGLAGQADRLSKEVGSFFSALRTDVLGRA